MLKAKLMKSSHIISSPRIPMTTKTMTTTVPQEQVQYPAVSASLLQAARMRLMLTMI